MSLLCCVVMLNVAMLSVANEPIMLSVIVLSVIMLSVIMLSVIMLSVVMLNVAMLSVVAPYRNVSRSRLIFRATKKFYFTGRAAQQHQSEFKLVSI
jgi:hypothetical protein